MTSPLFGFVGLGDMGSPMAMRLLDGGLSPAVFDIAERATHPFADRGAIVAVSAGELAARCDVVLSCLPTPSICLSVAREVVARPDRRTGTYVEMSTVGVDAITEIDAVLSAGGITLLDSPVSGGPRAIAAGRLTCFASGPGEAVDRVKPAYDILANRFFHLGEQPGLAQAMKVGNNLMAAANLAVTSEVVRMLEVAGIAPSVAVEIINVSTGRNRASEELFPKQILTGEFRQGAKLEILAKDTQLALAAAARYGAMLPIGTATGEVWAAAANGGLGQADITRIYDWVGRAIRGS